MPVRYKLRHPVGLQPTDLDPWGRPGPIVQPAWAVRWDTVAESDQIQVLVEAWVPACEGVIQLACRKMVENFPLYPSVFDRIYQSTIGTPGPNFREISDANQSNRAFSATTHGKSQLDYTLESRGPPFERSAGG